MSNYTVMVSDEGDKKDSILYEEFNERVAEHTVTIGLQNRQKHEACKVFAQHDSLTFLADSTTYYKSQSEIRLVSYSRPIEGIIFGFIDGSFVGAGVGTLIGQAGHSHNAERFWGGFVGAICGSSIGAIVGLVYGIADPPQTIFLFNSHENRVRRKLENAP
jgi:hypothetical protein